MAYKRFQKGTGVFVCNCCKNKTRAVNGDAENVGLCVECYDVAGCVNEVSDGIDGAEARLKAAVETAVKVRNCQNCAAELGGAA